VDILNVGIYTLTDQVKSRVKGLGLVVTHVSGDPLIANSIPH